MTCLLQSNCRYTLYCK